MMAILILKDHENMHTLKSYNGNCRLYGPMWTALTDLSQNAHTGINSLLVLAGIFRLIKRLSNKLHSDMTYHYFGVQN